MKNFYKPQVIRQLLQKWQIAPRKALSQNFLIDQNIIKKILQTAKIQENDWILEIGPGLGCMTEAFLEKGARVIAVEKDKTFAEHLRKSFCNSSFHLIEGDFLDFSLDRLQEFTTKKIKVVANLPYNIATPIITKLLHQFSYFSQMTLMVQQEMAYRMIATKNDKNYSSFSVFLRLYATTSITFSVQPNSFYPPPKVLSSVVHLLPDEHPIEDKKAFEEFVRTAFQQRRKKLCNSLSSLFSKSSIERALQSCKLPIDVRPQNLSLEEYISLYKELKK